MRHIIALFATVGCSTSEPAPSPDESTTPIPQPLRAAPGQWIRVEPGAFMMGASPSDDCVPDSTVNQAYHHVQLTAAFELAATEVTWQDLATARGAPDHHDPGDCPTCPANMMTWHRAAETCNAYSAYSGLPACYECAGSGLELRCREVDAARARACHGYRLPTEAEWEYAQRAGTSTTIFSGRIANCAGFDSGLSSIAWYSHNADQRSHPVATKLANAWGLYDMNGNLWEWTGDGYVTDLSTQSPLDPAILSTDGFRVQRGGSWNCIPHELRSGHRVGIPGEIGGGNFGVRCARSL